MANDYESIKQEYNVAKSELDSLRTNLARASLRGDSAIVRSYHEKIEKQLEVLARIERRLFRSVANDNTI